MQSKCKCKCTIEKTQVRYLPELTDIRSWLDRREGAVTLEVDGIVEDLQYRREIDDGVCLSNVTCQQHARNATQIALIIH